MATSFCSQIAAKSPNARYYRGPTLLGLETDEIAGQAAAAVASMFLFDAVDMQFSNAGLCQTIPDNVGYVAHARTAQDIPFWVRNPVKSRFYFYNTGRWLAGSGHLDERFFVGPHAAAGGVPWGDVEGDGGCSTAVATWMTERLNLRGVPVQLRG